MFIYGNNVGTCVAIAMKQNIYENNWGICKKEM